jgi:hypothetical protein
VNVNPIYDSNVLARAGAPREGPRRVIASFDDYAKAEAAVDHLADAGFDVKRITIVGRNLNFVEQMTGKLNAWRAALSGVLSGASLGLLFGLLFGVWFSHDGSSLLAIVVYWVWVAAFIGCVMSLVSYALSGGRRNFASVSAVVAGAYDVIADEEVADDAARVLAKRHATRSR